MLKKISKCVCKLQSATAFVDSLFKWLKTIFRNTMKIRVSANDRLYSICARNDQNSETVPVPEPVSSRSQNFSWLWHEKINFKNKILNASTYACELKVDSAS